MLRPAQHRSPVMIALTLGLLLPHAPKSAAAVTFVRVTDPTNPVVGDALMSGGGCWLDLVGDGYLDLFVANGNLTNQPDALYRNTRGGGFVKVVTGPVVSAGGSSIGGTVGDFDNDGRNDLYVTNRGNFGNFLFRGLGDTLFTRITTGPAVTNLGNSNSSSWVDADNDGLLDLFVVNFQGFDYIYRNTGAPTFALARVDTTALTPGGEFSIPGAWADYNGDGLEDVFVGNAGNQNDYLYTNHGHLWFTRQIIADGLSTLGASWGDYDNDGWLDLVVTHYTGQPNTLYHNSGPPLFTLDPVIGSAIAATAGNWVGSAWGDYDNDGALDLYLGNDGAAGALLHNDGPPGYGFTKVPTGVLSSDLVNAFGAVWGDYDRDGQLDLFVADHVGSGNRLYHNSGGGGHWLTLRGHGTASNRSAIGAKLRVRATIGGVPRWQLREVTGQTGYNSSNLDQHFGLGDAVSADSVVVEWPSGRRDVWANVAADQWLVLTEGTGTVGVGPSDPTRGMAIHLSPPRPNPVHDAGSIRFTIPVNAYVRVEVFDVGGRRLATLLDDDLGRGPHDVEFRVPTEWSAGVYLCRLSAGGVTRVARMLVTR